MLALIAPKTINPRIILSANNVLVLSQYSSNDQFDVDSEPADLNMVSTRTPVIIIGITIMIATFSHPKPENFMIEPRVTPEINPPIIGGPIVLPIWAPVRCIDKAKPFLSGYLAASVPKAGACQKLVPKPISMTPSNIRI